MIALGLILLIIGFIVKIPILWTIGIIALVIGLVLFAAGALGHAVGLAEHHHQRRVAVDHWAQRRDVRRGLQARRDGEDWDKPGSTRFRC